MRPDRRNPLDLNNLPEEYGRDGKQIFDESSNNILTEASDTNTKCRKKKSGEKDECGKVYECRFCSLKFCKSQALGGHMNRHRQERETETLDRARQLVFNNDNLQQGNPHLGLRDMNMGGGQSGVPPGNFGDPSSSLPYRSAYRSRLLSTSSPTILSPTQPLPSTPQPYLYPPSPRLMSYSTQYPTHPMSDYVVGHVLTGTSHCPAGVSSYTCIGAPLGRDFQPEDRVAGGEDGRQRYGGTTQHLNPSSINRFHDGY